LSSFISEYFNFLQQKKVYENFESLFNQKLNLFNSKFESFGKKNFGIIHEQFTEEIGNSMERILINGIFRKVGSEVEDEFDLMESLLTGGK
jgi:lantibiotic modifying enzyme